MCTNSKPTSPSQIAFPPLRKRKQTETSDEYRQETQSDLSSKGRKQMASPSQASAAEQIKAVSPHRRTNMPGKLDKRDGWVRVLDVPPGRLT